MKAGCVTACPGCSHRLWTLNESIAQKSDWLSRQLFRWKDSLESLRFLESERWSYRNKTCLRAEWDSSENRWKLGLRVRAGVSPQCKPLYEVIDIPDCPVHSEQVRKIVRAFSEKMPGGIPWIFLGVSGRQVSVVFKSKTLPDLSEVLGSVESPGTIDLNALGLDGVWANLNPSAGERVFSSRGWNLLWGKESSQFSVELEAGRSFPFSYGPESFQQLILPLYLQALEEARTFFGLKQGDRVLDLCSGIGVSLKKWQVAQALTLGIELNGDAFNSAQKNAGIESILQGRVSERIPQMEAWLHQKAREHAGISKASSPASRTFVFANPPRLGLEPQVTEWLGLKLRPASIAYLSCSAGTLARDLTILQDAGYHVRRIIPYDFFPQTPHVETLALLERAS